MLDRNSEFNKHAQRRMDEHFKPIHILLVEWSSEARHDGAPRWPAETILARIIADTALGAAQAGGPSLPVPRRIEFADWAVAQLREIKRKVLFCEYVNCVCWAPDRKRQWLRSRYGIRMSASSYTNNLNTAREIVFTLCRTHGRMLNINIV
jgi:hypothetical protein